MFWDTVRNAKRFFKIVGGFVLIIVGTIMIFTPGPGWVAIILGLGLLAAEFVWARRLLERLKAQGIRVRDAVLPGSSSKV